MDGSSRNIFLGGFVWEQGTGIHRRCAHGCITEPTERESIRPAPLSRRVGVAGPSINRIERFWGTRNCFKFAALFVDAERTEVHGTFYFQQFKLSGTGLERCAPKPSGHVGLFGILPYLAEPMVGPHLTVVNLQAARCRRTLGSRSAGSVAHPCAQRLWMPVLVQRPSLICVDPAKNVP